MEVKLTDDNMNAIIAKAVIDSLTPERRDELVQNAIKKLLERKTSDRYDARSVFQTAFDNAIAEVATRVARERLQDDQDIKEKLSKLFTDAWTKLTTEDAYGTVVDKVKDAMIKGLTGERY